MTREAPYFSNGSEISHCGRIVEIACSQSKREMGGKSWRRFHEGGYIARGGSSKGYWIWNEV